MDQHPESHTVVSSDTKMKMTANSIPAKKKKKKKEKRNLQRNIKYRSFNLLTAEITSLDSI